MQNIAERNEPRSFEAIDSMVLGEETKPKP